MNLSSSTDRLSLTNKFSSLIPLNWLHCINCPAYSISEQTTQKTLFLCCCIQLLPWKHTYLRSHYIATTVVYLLISQMLASRRSTCHNINAWDHLKSIFHKSLPSVMPTLQPLKWDTKLNFTCIPNWQSLRVGMHIIPPKVISTAYLIYPFHQ
jgi:hypothetical protein